MKRYSVRRMPEARRNWSTAEVLSALEFPWERRPAPRTEFRALWNDEHLHFRFDCVDDDLVLGGGASAKDRVIASDRVELFLAPALDLNPYYCFEMSPSGDVLAYRARHYRQMDWDWACDSLTVRAEVDGKRYCVEGSVPLETLRKLEVLKPDAREFFAGVYRAEFSHEPAGSIHSGWMAWVNPKTEQPDFHVPGSFGVFELTAR